MGTYHTIYYSTRYKSVKNARKSEKKCNFVERNGVVDNIGDLVPPVAVEWYR